MWCPSWVRPIFYTLQRQPQTVHWSAPTCGLGPLPTWMLPLCYVLMANKWSTDSNMKSISTLNSKLFWKQSLKRIWACSISFTCLLLSKVGYQHQRRSNLIQRSQICSKVIGAKEQLHQDRGQKCIIYFSPFWFFSFQVVCTSSLSNPSLFHFVLPGLCSSSFPANNSDHTEDEW